MYIGLNLVVVITITCLDYDHTYGDSYDHYENVGGRVGVAVKENLKYWGGKSSRISNIIFHKAQNITCDSVGGSPIILTLTH